MAITVPLFAPLCVTLVKRRRRERAKLSDTIPLGTYAQDKDFRISKVGERFVFEADLWIMFPIKR